ncbi:DUF3047 domain-containing protein [bacterium]|nr:DUF3047 domain-containing protein [bacterium]
MSAAQQYQLHLGQPGRRTGNVGSWQEETVNVYEDYLKVFGEPPPQVASLAIMNDSDNTGEAATSYIDFIEVRKPGR